MKPDLVVAIIAGLVAVAEALNVYLFLRIRVAQLEGEQRILKQVDETYVRKDSALLIERPHGATA